AGRGPEAARRGDPRAPDRLTRMRIDAHQHFWSYSPAAHGWIDGSMGSLKRDFFPEHLAPLLRSQGFDGSIAVQAASDEAETRWLCALPTRYPFVLGVVGWTDLCARDAERRIERLAAEPSLVGLRHGVQDEPDARFLVRPDFVRGLSHLAR